MSFVTGNMHYIRAPFVANIKPGHRVLILSDFSHDPRVWQTVQATCAELGAETTVAISPVRPLARLRAPGCGTYPSRFATSRTRARVDSGSRPFPDNACDTVVMDTPASRATSLIPIRFSFPLTRDPPARCRPW